MLKLYLFLINVESSSWLAVCSSRLPKTCVVKKYASVEEHYLDVEVSRNDEVVQQGLEEGTIHPWLRAELARGGNNERVNGKVRQRHTSKPTWSDEERAENIMGRRHVFGC